MTTSSIASDIDLDKKQVFQITWKPYYRFYLSKLVPARACRESLFLIKASFLNRLHGAESPFKTFSRGHLILSHFFFFSMHMWQLWQDHSRNWGNHGLKKLVPDTKLFEGSKQARRRGYLINPFIYTDYAEVEVVLLIVLKANCPSNNGCDVKDINQRRSHSIGLAFMLH